jgi:hypothetical protein
MHQTATLGPLSLDGVNRARDARLARRSCAAHYCMGGSAMGSSTAHTWHRFSKKFESGDWITLNGEADTLRYVRRSIAEALS